MHDTLRPLLGRNLMHPILQVVTDICFLAGPDDDPGGLCEEVIHLLKRAAGGLRQDEPEEDGVGEIADDEEEVEFVADVFHGDGGDLALDTQN